MQKTDQHGHRAQTPMQEMRKEVERLEAVLGCKRLQLNRRDQSVRFLGTLMFVLKPITAYCMYLYRMVDGGSIGLTWNHSEKHGRSFRATLRTKGGVGVEYSPVYSVDTGRTLLAEYCRMLELGVDEPTKVFADLFNIVLSERLGLPRILEGVEHFMSQYRYQSARIGDLDRARRKLDAHPNYSSEGWQNASKRIYDEKAPILAEQRVLAGEGLKEYPAVTRRRIVDESGLSAGYYS